MHPAAIRNRSAFRVAEVFSLADVRAEGAGQLLRLGMEPRALMTLPPEADGSIT